MESKMGGWLHAHLSDGGGSPRRAERVASRSGGRGCVRGNTQSLDWLPLSESDFVRIHATGGAPAEYNVLPTGPLIPPGKRMVHQIHRFSLECALETRHPNDNPGQSGSRKDLDAARADA